MKKYTHILIVLSFLTANILSAQDCVDDATGAFAIPEVYNGFRKLGLNPKQYLDRNDSYTFFDQVDGLLRTGPTRTNVGDLQVLLITK